MSPVAELRHPALPGAGGFLAPSSSYIAPFDHGDREVSRRMATTKKSTKTSTGTEADLVGRGTEVGDQDGGATRGAQGGSGEEGGDVGGSDEEDDRRYQVGRTGALEGAAAAVASSSSSKAATSTAATPAVEADAGGSDHEAVPAPRGHTKDGIAYTKDFDAKFLKAQRDLLIAERKALLGQADRLEDEANSLIEDGEMGDVQFDDESGEGDTMVVERERDLALSA